MYTITRREWEKLKSRNYPDYISHPLWDHEWNGKKCTTKDWCCMASVLPGYPGDPNGTRLLFEHIHFEITD